MSEREARQNLILNSNKIHKPFYRFLNQELRVETPVDKNGKEYKKVGDTSPNYRQVFTVGGNYMYVTFNKGSISLKIPEVLSNGEKVDISDFEETKNKRTTEINGDRLKRFLKENPSYHSGSDVVEISGINATNIGAVQRTMKTIFKK